MAACAWNKIPQQWLQTPWSSHLTLLGSPSLYLPLIYQDITANSECSQKLICADPSLNLKWKLPWMLFFREHSHNSERSWGAGICCPYTLHWADAPCCVLGASRPAQSAAPQQESWPSLPPKTSSWAGSMETAARAASNDWPILELQKPPRDFRFSSSLLCGGEHSSLERLWESFSAGPDARRFQGPQTVKASRFFHFPEGRLYLSLLRRTGNPELWALE